MSKVEYMQGTVDFRKSLDSFEQNLLNDLMCLKVIEVLFDKSIIDDWSSRTIDVSINTGDLPPPVLAVLQRANIITHTMIVNPLFLNLIRERGNFFKQKVKYLVMAIQDFLDSAELLLWEPEVFMQKSRIFSCFDYSKGFDISIQAQVDTKCWSEYVSALSRAEASVIVNAILNILGTAHPRNVLELGGNMGVFAEVLEKSLAFSDYQIIDIPQVCNLGQTYIRNKAPESRIRFVAGDMFTEDWCKEGSLPPDLIIFKSVLHDWPADRVASLIEKSCKLLPVGGRLCIVERCKFTAENLLSSKLFDAANIVFSPFYRNPDSYVSMINSITAHEFNTRIQSMELDMRWFCLLTEKIR